MKMEHLVFLNNVSFLPCALRKLPEAFVLSAYKLCYPLYFNTRENLKYVGHVPEMAYHGVDEMREEERNGFLVWYESHKSETIDNRNVLESYCHDDVIKAGLSFV